MATKTGTYTGLGPTGPKTVSTGLAAIRTLSIYKLATSSASGSTSSSSSSSLILGHTTDAIQSIMGSSAFVLNSATATGLTIDGGSFIVTNENINKLGTQYCWEANGD